MNSTPLFWMTALGVAASLLTAGCSSPRGCEDETDCFRNQTCSEGVCIDEMTESDTDVPPPRDSGDSTSDPRPDSDDHSADSTADGSGISDGTTNRDSSGRELENDTEGRTCTGTAPCSSGDCSFNDEKTFQFGCVDQGDGTYSKVVAPPTHNGCLCSKDEGDERRDDFKLYAYSDRGGCAFDPTVHEIKVTVTVEGCSADEMQGIIFRSGNNQCSSIDNVSCTRDRERRTLTLTWQPGDGATEYKKFHLYAEHSSLAFPYDVTVELQDRP